MENIQQALINSHASLCKVLRELDQAQQTYELLAHKHAKYTEEDLQKIEILRNKKGYICDMDGTLWVSTKQGQNKPLVGASKFIRWALKNGKEILCLTNGSASNSAQLRAKFKKLMEIDLPEECFINSAHSTAMFIAEQQPGATCYAVGAPALKEALTRAGLKLVEDSPDYVVMGESRHYEYDEITTAINFINKGARFLATNDDVTAIDEHGEHWPSTGAFAKIIESATGVKAYYLGKPNSLMMRHAVDRMKCSPNECAIIGDRMDTDILSGTEALIAPVLVLTGVTKREHINRFPYKPFVVLNSVADIVPEED